MRANIFSVPGVRDRNEDTVYPEPGLADESLFILADGLGGHLDGKLASQLACEEVRKILLNEDPTTFVMGGQDKTEADLMQSFLADAVRQAGAVVWHEARQHGSDMGSTLLVVLLKGQSAYCAHVGDCAAFVAAVGAMPMTKLTTEHRRGSNLIRSLGATEYTTPDIFYFPFTAESVLVIGCDGFWEHMTTEQMGQFLLECPLSCVATELGRAALDAGSKDNVSVLVVEGDRFIAAHAAQQITSYAGVLATRDDGEEATAKRRALLDFCIQYPAGAANLPLIMKNLLVRLPDSKKQWARMRPLLPQPMQEKVDLLLTPQIPDQQMPRTWTFSAAPGMEAHEPGPAQLVSPATESTHALQDVLNLLDKHTYVAAFKNLETALKQYPELRDDAVHELTRRERTMRGAIPNWDKRDFYAGYVRLFPEDDQAKWQWGETLWLVGELDPAIDPLEELYVKSSSWQQRVVTCLKQGQVSLDVNSVRRLYYTFRDEKGIGLMWALEQLARLDPAFSTEAEEMATQVRSSWPAATEMRAAEDWLQQRSPSQPQHPQKALGSQDRMLLMRVEELGKKVKTLEAELASSQGILQEYKKREADMRLRLTAQENRPGTPTEWEDCVLILGARMVLIARSFPSTQPKLAPDERQQIEGLFRKYGGFSWDAVEQTANARLILPGLGVAPLKLQAAPSPQPPTAARPALRSQQSMTRQPAPVKPALGSQPPVPAKAVTTPAESPRQEKKGGFHLPWEKQT